MPYCYRRKTDMEHRAQTHLIDNAPRASTKRREPARSAREKMKEKKGKERLSLPFTTCTPLCCRSMNPALASVVQRLDSAIHRITLYPVDSAISFPNTYPLDSDLSGG